MADPNQQPATRQDVIDLEGRLEQRLIDKIQAIVRVSQTEILRVFESHARSQDIRTRKLEADFSNLNTSQSTRMAILEERMTWIEQNLLGGNPQRPQ